MSTGKAPGWMGITTSALVAAALPGLAKWLFPDWDAFFEFGSRWLGVVWTWLTAEWTLPAVPLLLAVLVGLVLAIKIAKFDVVPAASFQQKPSFTQAQLHVLMSLLHAPGNRLELEDLLFHTKEPRLAIEVGAADLVRRGLLTVNDGYAATYELSEAGKALTLEVWQTWQQT